MLSALQTWIGRLDKNDPHYEHHMMEALWVQQWHNRVDQALLKRMLRSTEPWARAAATRVLCYWRDRVPDALALLKVQANDEHPAVRLEAVRAASFFMDPDAIAIAQEAQKHPQDRFLEYTDDADDEDADLAREERHDGGHPAPANTTAAALPDLSAAAMRRDLRDKGVQTIVVGTIPEQMLFDVKWFVVEAGKPVRVTLTNADAMPHNIVIGQPGSVATIGNRGSDDAAAGRSECARLRAGHPAGAAGDQTRPARRIGHAQFHRANNAWRVHRSCVRSLATMCGCMA